MSPIPNSLLFQTSAGGRLTQPPAPSSGVVEALRWEMSERDRVLKILLVALLSLVVVLFIHQRLVLADIQVSYWGFF